MTTAFQQAYSSLGSQFLPYYQAAQAEYNVPASILAAQDYQESTFGTFPTGPGNGGGMAQFTPQTASSLGYTIQQLQNPVTAIQAQAKYDAQLYQENGQNWGKALQAYSGNTPGYATEVMNNANTIVGIGGPAVDNSGYAPVSSIPGPSQQTIQAQEQYQQSQANKPPAFSWLDPIPWIKFEGLNILLMALGAIAIILVFDSMFHISTVKTAAEVAEV